MEIPIADSQTCPTNLLQMALEIEEKATDFYRNIGEKSDFLSSQEMERFIEEQGNRKMELEKIRGEA